MPLNVRTQLLVLLSVLIVAPTSLVVLLWAGLYLLIGLHLRELPYPLLAGVFLIAAAALASYWVLLLDLCAARGDPLPARDPAWNTMLWLGVVLAIGLLAAGLLAGTGAFGRPADAGVAWHLLLTGPPVLLPTAWLLSLRREYAGRFN